VQEKVKAKYHVELTAQSLSFSGLQEVSMKQVSLIPDSADTLININSIKVNLSFFNFLISLSTLQRSFAMMTQCSLAFSYGA